jgi:hypothetical protein
MGAALVGSSLALLNESRFAFAASQVHATASVAPFGGSLPIVLPSADGRLEVFKVNSDGTLYHTWQKWSGSSGVWAPWYSHGRPPELYLYLPHLWYNSASQTLRLYSLTAPNDGINPISLYYLDQNAPSGGWSGWQALTPAYPTTDRDSTYSTLTVGTTANNLPSLFVGSSTDGTDALIHYLDGNSQSWLAFESPAGVKSPPFAPSTASGADGHQEFFTVIDGAVYHKWQFSPNGAWSNWYSHGMAPSGRAFSETVVAASADGHLELFASDGSTLYHKWQVAPNAGFNNWTSVDASVRPYGHMAMHAHADGRLALFVTTNGGTVYHMEQTSPNGAWGRWISHGNPSGNDQLVLSVCSTNNMLVVFASDGWTSNIYYLWQTAANGSAWVWNTLQHPPLTG